MDEIDIRICTMLLMNSRQPYRELADKLGLSLNAVFKRVQNLIDTGLIVRFSTSINLNYYNGINVWIFGHTDRDILDINADPPAGDENIYWIARCGGNYVYIGAFLKDMNELDACASMVKKEFKLIDMIVAIYASSDQPLVPGFTLSKLDHRIIEALHDDSRKSLADIAMEVGTSTKTVSTHIDRMTSENLISFSIDWYPDKSNNIIATFHLSLPETVEKKKAGMDLLQKYHPNAIFFSSFVNIPNFLILGIWAPTMKTVNDIRLKLQHEFPTVIPNVIYAGKVFKTWKDKEIDEKGSLP
jgi:DNA-binding Lrp family transcriptional regulator